ncbi:MAG: hypothetical protein ACJ786_09720 [Catenulispora sp.]
MAAHGQRPAWSGGRIAGPDDVRWALAEVTAAGLRRDNTAAAQLVQTADEAAFSQPDISRMLPCPRKSPGCFL